MKNFWTDLPRPIMALAPMVGVTDTVYRQIIARCGKPDVMFTEFTSCDGLFSPGREAVMDFFRFNQVERPLVAQIFGSKPDNFRRTAALAAELGFDGVDINAGCPDRNVEKQGAGASLINRPEDAKAILRAAKDGAGDLPISVKTRLGYDRNIIAEWTKHLLDAEPAAIIIHARTRNEMSKVDPHWDAIKDAVGVVRDSGSDALVLGNGDVTSIAEARQLAADTGADGIMIGRGVWANPWLFNTDRDPASITLEERLQLMLDHTRMYEDTWRGSHSFDIMKKFFKAYVQGFPAAKNLRMQLMECTSADDVEDVVAAFLRQGGKGVSPTF